MQAALLDMPSQMCPPFDVGTFGSFCGQSSSTQNILLHSDEELIRRLVLMLDNQLLAVLEARTVSEFAKVRAEIWPKYIRAHRALSDTMSNLASESKIAAISKECVAALVEDLQKQRNVRFGSRLTDQAVFAMWTLAKINALAQKVNDAGEPRDKDADLKLFAEYQLHLFWAQFHLDFVAAAMKFKKTVADDVQQATCDGLRASVKAYAILREALSLRTPPTAIPLPTTLPWDEEDEQLLASSMKDINADFS